MKKQSPIDMNEQIPSKNLGVAYKDGKVSICFIDTLSQNPAAYALDSFNVVDIKEVTPINDLFYKKEQPDNGPHGDKLAYIETNDNQQLFGLLSSEKSVVTLRNLSIYEPDIYWYNEDNGVGTVNVNHDKTFKLKDILKAQTKINKLEQKFQKEEQSEQGSQFGM